MKLESIGSDSRYIICSSTYTAINKRIINLSNISQSLEEKHYEHLKRLPICLSRFFKQPKAINGIRLLILLGIGIRDV